MRYKAALNYGDTFNSPEDIYKHEYSADVYLETAFKYNIKFVNRFSKDSMLNFILMYMEGSETEDSKNQELYRRRTAGPLEIKKNEKLYQ